jgi:hypothetical protein
MPKVKSRPTGTSDKWQVDEGRTHDRKSFLYPSNQTVEELAGLQSQPILSILPLEIKSQSPSFCSLKHKTKNLNSN